MVNIHHSEEAQEKQVCTSCVINEFVTHRVQKEGTQGRCSYCDRVATTISVEDLSQWVEKVLTDYFVRTPDRPPDDQSWDLFTEFEREGDPILDIIEEIVGLPGSAAQDVGALLEDRHSDHQSEEEYEFSSTSYYERRDATGNRWQGEWVEFVETIKTRERFFSPKAEKLLRSVFGEISSMRTFGGRSLIIDAGPGTLIPAVFRARVFQSITALNEALIRPDLQLASPPQKLARAGRMNAAGISVFYGADSDATALAEVRPPVGSDVAIARFEITRPLRLLDLTALDNIVIEDSVFDPAYEDRLEKAAFLKTLSRRLSAAILPDDETLAYLPTQAVADYLSGMNNPTLDGIIFPSVQSATRGLNIVFFQKASRVQDLDLPPNAEVGLSLWHIDPDDQWDFEYQVQERDPAQSRVSPLGSNAAGIDILPIVPTWTPDFSDKREVALRVDVKSVCVHHITGVEIQSRAIKVVRKRVGKGEGDD